MKTINLWNKLRVLNGNILEVKIRISKIIRLIEVIKIIQLVKCIKLMRLF